MNRISLGVLVSIAALFTLFFGPERGLTATPPPSPEVTVAAEPIEITAEDLGVPEPSWWQSFKRKFIRLFTFNQIKKQTLSLELANLTLLEAQQAALAGQTERATKLIAAYNQQISAISQATLTILEHLPNEPAAQSLVDRLTQDQILQVELIDRVATIAADQTFNTEIIQVRLEVLKKLTNLLIQNNLTPTELAQKIAKLEEKLTIKEAKAERKLLRRLRLLDRLEEATDDVKLEDVLEKKEREQLNEAAQTLPPETIGQVIRSIKGDITKHIAVLQSILSQVPDKARPALEKIIEEELAKLAERIKNGLDKIEETFENAEDAAVLEAQKQLVEKLRRRLEAQQQLAEQLAKEADKLQKKIEKRRQETTDDNEDEAVDEEAGTEAKAGDDEVRDKTEEASPAPTSSNPDSRPLNFEIKIKNSAFSGNLTLERGQKTRIKIKNEDTVNHSFNIRGLGVDSGTIEPGQEKEIEMTPISAGIYPISCDFHPTMTARVIVQ